MRKQYQLTFSKYRKILILHILIFLCIQTVVGQSRTTTTSSRQVYEVQDIDNKPEFPGGAQAISKFIAANYRLPDMDSYNGQVVVNFIVEIDGSLSDIYVVRDIGYGTGAEAARVFQKSPKWAPGILDGKPVRAKVAFPITLKSEDN